MLNTNTLVVDAAGNLMCWRQRMEDTHGVQIYLAALYEAMGLLALAGRLRVRTMDEQVVFSQRCRQAGVKVPAVIRSGNNWMLSTYIPGETLKDSLEKGSRTQVISLFLTGLQQAHRRGIALMDRWGGNEIVTPEEDIVFLDFDVQVTFAGARPFAALTAFDLAVAMRACCLWSPDKEMALTQLQSWWRENGRFYDSSLLARFLAGACDFYAHFDSLSGLFLSAPWSQHKLTNAAIGELIARLGD